MPKPTRAELIAEARQLSKLSYVALGPGTKECLAACADALEDADKRDPRYYSGDRLKWGSPLNIGHLIEQLKTLDPEMHVSSVLNIKTAKGSKARAFGLSMSYERWGEDGWLDYGNPALPRCIAIWAHEYDSAQKPIDGSESKKGKI